MTRVRFTVAVTLAALVALAGFAARAEAVSVGVYGSVGGGGGDWDDDGWERDTRHGGFGFALEAPVGFFPFSYRLGVGWEHIVFEGLRGLPDLDLDGVVVDQALTFDIASSYATRFWVGPELRLAFLQSDGSLGEDRNFFGAGVGPVLGVDLALGPTVALSWKLGFLVTSYSTDDDTWANDGSGDGHADDTLEEGHGYLSLTIFFRLWGGPEPGPRQYQPAPQYPPPPPPPPRGRW